VTAGLVLTGLAVDAPIGAAASLPVVSFPSTVLGQVEGNSGSANVVVTASLSQAATSPVTVHYATANGTATAADLDYVPATGTLTFPPGSTARTVAVTVNGDTKLEDYQRFTVKLSTPVGATTGHNAQIIEVRNDELPKLALAGASVIEGAPAHFLPKLSQAYYQALALTAQTANRTAVAPGDYTATSKPVTFAAGIKTATAVDVPTIADGITEPKETFALTVSGTGVAAPLTKLATIAASTGAATCNTGQAAPAHYEKVVVFSFENRSWSDVGGTGFTAMPYAHSLASSCSYFNTWTEANTSQNSATQYVSQGQGDTNHTVLNDCAPSATCQSTADNIFRQVRTAGRTAINYVEGATAPCSASGNAAKHIPALYYRGADDAANCTAQVRPYSEFAPTNLPAFSFVTPTLCNDGHDCTNTIVDQWMQQNIGAVIASADYQAGKVLIEIWYDEGAPVPNLYISPSAHPGPFATAGVGYASTLKLWEDALGLSCLANACTAPDLRPVTNV
jgi:hypothetical protein